MRRVTVKNYVCDVHLDWMYANGRKAIKLTVCQTGEPYTTATINIDEEELEPDEVIIKNYAGNTGLDKVLEDAGIISKPLRYVKTGHVTVPVCKLLITQ